MVKKSKKQKPDMVFDKDGMRLSTQPNQITDLHQKPSLYSERAQDELMWMLQPYYADAKRNENRRKEPTQMMIPFNNEDAYLVTPDRVGEFQNEGDFVATIRFRDLPGVTPRHYGELRQVLKEWGRQVAEVHGDNGILTTNFLDVIEEYETREVVNPKTGKKTVVKQGTLKRNEVKIRIRSEILRHNFFLTDAGYTQYYFPTTRHTKTATANRLYKWLSKWRGIKKDQMVMVTEPAADGTERSVGRIVFAADYIEVRDVCGLFNSEDGRIINGESVEMVAVNLATKDGKEWGRLKNADKDLYMEQARTKCSEKYAYYSEFAKRHLAQAKKELDDLSSRSLAPFTFDYRAIFADGRSKGKVPVKVEFTLTIFDLGRQLYENKELAAKEKLARDLMKERLALTAEQINGFINRLMPGDHDFLMDKLQRLIDINMDEPRDDVQHWACKCLNTFFEKELPEFRGSNTIEDAEAVEVPVATDLSPDTEEAAEDKMQKW